MERERDREEISPESICATSKSTSSRKSKRFFLPDEDGSASVIKLTLHDAGADSTKKLKSAKNTASRSLSIEFMVTDGSLQVVSSLT